MWYQLERVAQACADPNRWHRQLVVRTCGAGVGCQPSSGWKTRPGFCTGGASGTRLLDSRIISKQAKHQCYRFRTLPRSGHLLRAQTRKKRRVFVCNRRARCADVYCGAGVSPASCSRDGRTTIFGCGYAPLRLDSITLSIAEKASPRTPPHYR